MRSSRRLATTADASRRATLQTRMDRVLEALEAVRASPDPDPVHDLRVAIRRCRSVATIMMEVDPYRGWRSMKRLPRALFRTLGELRDVHILQEWVVRLVPEPLAAQLLQNLQARAGDLREGVARAVEQFDRKAWRRVARALEDRVSLVPPDGAAAQCLALERYEDLRRSHARALRTSAPETWHVLRIALKRFRYVVESLLPAKHALWQEDLRQAQDLLGRLHDLHALEAFVMRDVTGAGAETVGAVQSLIGPECQACIDQYRRRTRGRGSLLGKWRAGLPRAARVEAANAARIRATVKAVDPNLPRTMRISRLALEVFDALATAGVSTQLCDARTRNVLRAAARLHGLRADDNRVSRQKGAARIVRAMPQPIGWTKGEWDVVAWIVRYHRGAEPKPTNRAFARVPADRQEIVRGLAGVLRLARALGRGGAHTILAGTAYADSDVRLRVVGLADSRKEAARVAAAKHLLESELKRQVIIERG